MVSSAPGRFFRHFRTYMYAILYLGVRIYKVYNVVNEAYESSGQNENPIYIEYIEYIPGSESAPNV